MDFIADRLEGGRPFRVLTVIDQFTRECLKLEAAAHMSGSRVVECLERVAELRGYPQSPRCKTTTKNGALISQKLKSDPVQRSEQAHCSRFFPSP